MIFRGRPVTANGCPFNSRVSLVGDRMIHKDRSWPVPVIGVNEYHTYRKTALRRKANDIRLTRL